MSGTPSTASTVLFEHDQVRISAPFSLYVRDLMDDLEDPDRSFAEAVAEFPDDRFWELLVCNFASSSALSTGHIERSVRWCRRAVAADPDGLSAFWSTAQRCYLGVGLALLGDLDEGVALFQESWARYRAIGLRTNGSTWLASLAHALARAGRVAEAERALAEATEELHTYRDRYASSTLLLADAVLHDARGEDPRALLEEAAAVTTEQGARGMAARVDREAARLGIELPTPAR